MRFSVLSDVVSDKAEVDNFFEHIKQAPQIRRMPLFWLQWHMAKCTAGADELRSAEKLLKQGYTEAKEYERRTGKKFDSRQLDDRRAKFLMLRASLAHREGADLFRDFKEACELTDKILRQDDPQHYPFETLNELTSTYVEVHHHLLEVQAPIVLSWLKKLCDYAGKRIGVLVEGYQKNKAKSALDDAISKLSK